MKVYEFYLKEEFKAQLFEVLCEGFYNLGNVGKPRKVGGKDGSAVYAISRNPTTNWVQLLVDDNTPTSILTAIEARINGLSDNAPDKFTDEYDNVAPMERAKGATK